MDKIYPLIYHSWEILTQDVAIKHCDISVFQHHGSGIPIESRWFWGVDNLIYPDKVYYILKFAGKKYKAYIELDINNRTRLFWYQDLSHIFNELVKPEFNSFFPYLRFERTSKDVFNISFIDIQDVERGINDSCESEICETEEGRLEGKRYARYITKYERNPLNRLNAIKIHGTKCMACGFDFEKVYGNYGRNFIEVHHVKPLYDLGKEEVVNPQTDLVCLCSNCHRMIHRKKEAILSMEQLMQIIEETANIKE